MSPGLDLDYDFLTLAYAALPPLDDLLDLPSEREASLQLVLLLQGQLTEHLLLLLVLLF